MPVQNEQFKVDPYTSTVPLVQLPVQDMYSGAKTNPNVWGGKGTSALAIGDSLLKGFMQGHQLKEQKKYAQAEATIKAADAAAESAYAEYQTALTNAGGKVDDPKAQAAYDAYKATFSASKQAKAQFVLPDKTQKGKKSASESVTSAGVGGVGGKDKKPPSAGFNNIRDFFEANPHIVPQIALMTMQPKPPGLSPQREAQSLELDTAKRQNQEEQRKVNDRNMIAMYGKLTPEEIAKLPAEEQKKINDPQSGLAVAKNRYAMENRDKAKPDWFVDESGNFHQVAVGEEPPPGWKKYEKSPVNESQSNMYYDAAARAWGTTRDKLSVQQLEYVDALRARSKAQSSGQTTYSYSTTDTSGNRSTTTRKVSDPIKTPAGVSPLPEKVFGEPPAASQQSSPGSGPITPPPAAKAAPAGQGVPPTAPKGSTQFTVGAKPKGMVEEGNLPIWNRPAVQNDDKSHSSEYSTSFEQDGKEVLVPTVVNGKFLTPDGKKPKPGSPEEKSMLEAARKHYEETGENLGKFANSKDADAYANTLHSRGEKKGGAKGPITPPPQGGKAAKGGPSGSKETFQTTQRANEYADKRQAKYDAAEVAYNKAVTTQKDANDSPIDPKVAATNLAKSKNDTDANYRNKMRTARLNPGDVYVYFVDPATGSSWQRTVPDERTVDDLRKYAQSKGKQFENLSNDEVESVIGMMNKLGPPPGSQPETQTYGGHTYKLNPKTKQYDRVKETSQ